MPKGVECPHAGYVNLALSYADYFDLLPGMDATSLTSSLGYDGSISEMYSAWVSGCAVVMLTKEQIRSGPDLVPVLAKPRSRCSSVLRCCSPPSHQPPNWICPIRCAATSFRRAKPSPARSWSPGPGADGKSSTLTAHRGEHRHEPPEFAAGGAHHNWLAIRQRHLRHPRGRPTPTTAPRGGWRALYRWGARCTRYRNLPEQTAQKFITHPQFGRLYRTGDKCKIDIQTQRVHFLGRIDTQLKVRGHRVEAQAVEDILQTQFREIEAAVLDYQNETLVAFVAAPSVCEGKISVVAPRRRSGPPG
jgi:Non-ribosomal peptide synthetase modules and related proteins